MTTLIHNDLIDKFTADKNLDFEIIKLLLEKGAKFTEKAINNLLVYQIYNNPKYNNILDLLLQENHNYINEKVIEYIIKNDKTEFFKILLNNKIIFTKEHTAKLIFSHGSLEIVKLFLKTGYELTDTDRETIVSMSDRDRNSNLVYKKIKLIKYLLEHDKRITSNMITVATFSSNVEILKLLLNHN
jgi:hypothetical protein